MPLSSAVDVRSLPKSLILGIPEELINRFGDEDLIFAQYARISPSDGIFAVSTRCGRDQSGRVVFLTAIQFLAAGQSPSTRLDRKGLPPDAAACAERTEERLSDESDPWSSRVHRMLQAVKSEHEIRDFASVELRRVHYKPAWHPEKKKHPSSD